MVSKATLKEQLQQNLLQVFEDVNITDTEFLSPWGESVASANDVRDRVLDHMCDVIIKTVDEHLES
tara:strand:+ start:130 stop:327 length:198 start_codon:yes stop_codon:yes gene_type:complete